MLEALFFKKKLLIGLLAVSTGLVLFAVYYFPQRKALVGKKEDFSRLQQELRELRDLDLNDSSLSGSLVALKKKEGFLNKSFPQSEEKVMEVVSELALKRGLHIAVMKTAPLNLDRRKEAFIISLDKNISKIRLSLNVKGIYSQLGKFLKDLRQSGQMFAVLDDLAISKNPREDKLDIRLKLSFYLRPLNG